MVYDSRTAACTQCVSMHTLTRAWPTSMPGLHFAQLAPHACLNVAVSLLTYFLPETKFVHAHQCMHMFLTVFCAATQSSMLTLSGPVSVPGEGYVLHTTRLQHTLPLDENGLLYSSPGLKVHPIVKCCHNITVQVYLITELVTGGELLEAVLQRGSYSELEARLAFVQLLHGIQYLHSK